MLILSFRCGRSLQVTFSPEVIIIRLRIVSSGYDARDAPCVENELGTIQCSSTQTIERTVVQPHPTMKAAKKLPLRGPTSTVSRIVSYPPKLQISTVGE